MNTSDAKRQFKEAIERAQRELNEAAAKARAQIGDQDGDGDVDLTDARIKATAAIGGVSKREAFFLAAGLAAGFVLAKVVPWLMKIVG